MQCRKCPHHLRHGQVDQTTKAITFKDRCSLRLKEQQDCGHYPFAKYFDYMTCETYKATFKGAVDRKGVMPPGELQFSDSVTAGGIADMELL